MPEHSGRPHRGVVGAGPAGTTVDLDLSAVPHVLSALRPVDLTEGPDGGSLFHAGGPTSIVNDTEHDARWFVVELSHLAHPATRAEESP